MKSELANDVETLRSEIAQIRMDLVRLGDTLELTVHHGRSEASARIHESLARFRGGAVNAQQGIVDGIGAKPLRSMLAAFSVGLLAGLVATRHRG